MHAKLLRYQGSDDSGAAKGTSEAAEGSIAPDTSFAPKSRLAAYGVFTALEVRPLDTNLAIQYADELLQLISPYGETGKSSEAREYKIDEGDRSLPELASARDPALGLAIALRGLAGELNDLVAQGINLSKNLSTMSVVVHSARSLMDFLDVTGNLQDCYHRELPDRIERDPATRNFRVQRLIKVLIEKLPEVKAVLCEGYERP